MQYWDCWLIAGFNSHFQLSMPLLRNVFFVVNPTVPCLSPISCFLELWAAQTPHFVSICLDWQPLTASIFDDLEMLRISWNHPFLDGIFHQINHPAIWVITPMYGNPHIPTIYMVNVQSHVLVSRSSIFGSGLGPGAWQLSLLQQPSVIHYGLALRSFTKVGWRNGRSL